MHMNSLKKTGFIVSTVFVLAGCSFLFSAGWQNGNFTIGDVNGRKMLVSPAGKPFYSIAMCYAWGPDTGTYSGQPRTLKRISGDLAIMKKHGFNTLNLYGLDCLDDVLKWCDDNEFGFYPRMSYYNLSDFPKELKEFPDFMNPDFRRMAKKYFDQYCPIFRKHPSVIALDLDQRWMFPLDWGGENRVGKPMLGSASVAYLPKWLKDQYKDIGLLNKIWRKNYRTFEDVLSDGEIIKNGIMQDVKKFPWRLDIYNYTLWTINDFLKDLTAYIRTIDIPQRLITYTTEHPEVCPNPVSTKAGSGIDFISPVQYNQQADYNRDWIGLGQLLYTVKWQADLNDMPAYISETGFRTSPLKQNPPFMLYAAGKPGDEKFIAEMYLRQTALENIWPWMLGWTHFKLYDKLVEGDFGYLRDDRTLKPISELGEYINDKLQINNKKEKDTEVWIFFPDYAIASPFASYQQFKSLVLALEFDFLKEFDRMIGDVQKYISMPSSEIQKSELLTKMQDLYDSKWVSFKFTSKIPDDEKPVLLAGRSLEQLSLADREKLKNKKVITMVQAGMEDERYNKTDKWFLSLLDLNTDKFKSKVSQLDIGKYLNNNAFSGSVSQNSNNLFLDADSLPAGGLLFSCAANDIPFKFPEKTAGKNNNIECNGQTIRFSPDSAGKIHFLAAAHGGDTGGSVKLVYKDGSSETVFMGETVTDYHYAPVFGHYAVSAKDANGKAAYLCHAVVNANAAKKIIAIILPSSKRLHVFGITLESGSGSIPDVTVQVKADGLESKGKAYWQYPLEKNEISGKVLAVFADDKVAVCQSRDGKKTVFLYDALTWKGDPSEISKDLGLTASILKKTLNSK
jgi:hypothetical protein